jgi:hypothetical protein
MTYLVTVDTEHGQQIIDLDSLDDGQLIATEDSFSIVGLTSGDNLIAIEINSQNNPEAYNLVREYLSLLDGGFQAELT